MAHFSLQLGAAIVVPFGDLRRKRQNISQLKARFLRETAAMEAGLPVRSGRFRDYARALLVPSTTAQSDHRLNRTEA